MPLTMPRYDGLADWYDSWNEPHAARNAAEVLELLGPGEGLCLDLGCGMRHHPLADLLNGFLVSGLVIEHVAEPGDRPVPVILAIRARKPRPRHAPGCPCPLARCRL
jgi:hypothetical protein